MPESISVIICTSPGREDNLHHCLQMLTRQSHPPDEVIVVSDGASRSEFVCQPFIQSLRLQHLWRPNDMCVSRSRNRGAQRAQGRILVFLDTDVLLNPHAIAAYIRHFEQRPDDCIYGYFGYVEAFVAPSQWFPQRRVNFLDIRFCGYSPDQILPSPYLQNYPHWYALGANLGIRRTQFVRTGGFNEQLIGWGTEDLDFAERLCRNHIPIGFSIDVWGEHQLHPRSGHYYQMHGISKPFVFDSYPVPRALIHRSDAAEQALLRHIFTDYSVGLDLDALSQAGYTPYHNSIVLSAEQFPQSIRHHLPGGAVPPMPNGPSGTPVAVV
jgi:glycosyltransferase involved in cell wall biosynthesis